MAFPMALGCYTCFLQWQFKGRDHPYAIEAAVTADLDDGRESPVMGMLRFYSFNIQRDQKR
jgi:hypothetical protein